MAKYDWNTIRNYVAFHAGRMAPGTRHPHHDSELISCYHDAFLTWGHYQNNIVLFYHDSPITRSHFMDPTDRAIKGFYCNTQICIPRLRWVSLEWVPFLGTADSGVHIVHIRKLTWSGLEQWTTWTVLTKHLSTNSFSSVTSSRCSVVLPANAVSTLVNTSNVAGQMAFRALLWNTEISQFTSWIIQAV